MNFSEMKLEEVKEFIRFLKEQGVEKYKSYEVEFNFKEKDKEKREEVSYREDPISQLYQQYHKEIGE